MSTAKAISNAILSIKPLGSSIPMPTLDPFLFCVYHKDLYPPGNEQMEAPNKGNGHDFNSNQPYRMYHGEHIPGFPQHPHRGFETITATIDGIIDHADSMGNAGRYGLGDVQWMTAGKGIVHCEMFPLLKQKQQNPLRFFQIWLNLPSYHKMVPPDFAMFWSNTIPQYNTDDNKVHITLWNGNNYFDMKGLNPNIPPPNSWATDPEHDVAIWHITIQPGGTITLPPAHKGNNVNRCLFYIEGDNQQMMVDQIKIDERVVVQVNGEKEIPIHLISTATKPGEFLLLQGIPIQEPVEQYGPFVMNNKNEIQQAFHDYQQTKFGDWSWIRDDMIFDKTKGRFAKLNGIETYPTDDICLTD